MKDPDDTTPPDMTDPKVLEDQCRVMAEGMRQQARCAATQSAAGGHPYPEYFFGEAAKLYEAVVAYFEKNPKNTAEKPAAVKK